MYLSVVMGSLSCGICATWSQHLRLFYFIATFKNVRVNSWRTSLLLLISRSGQPSIPEDRIFCSTPVFHWRALLQAQLRSILRVIYSSASCVHTFINFVSSLLMSLSYLDVTLHLRKLKLITCCSTYSSMTIFLLPLNATVFDFRTNIFDSYCNKIFSTFSGIVY